MQRSNLHQNVSGLFFLARTYNSGFLGHCLAQKTSNPYYWWRALYRVTRKTINVPNFFILWHSLPLKSLPICFIFRAHTWSTTGVLFDYFWRVSKFLSWLAHIYDTNYSLPLMTNFDAHTPLPFVAFVPMPSRPHMLYRMPFLRIFQMFNIVYFYMEGMANSLEHELTT